MRNLEEIQEEERPRGPGRFGVLLIGSLGIGALIAVAVLSARGAGGPAQSGRDPLDELVRRSESSARPADELSTDDVSFPSLLSDSESPTTALAAVKDGRGRLVEQSLEVEAAERAALMTDQGPEQAPPLQLPPGAPTTPPPPGDTLPVVPLPAGSLLHATPVTLNPRDRLTKLAVDELEKQASPPAKPSDKDAEDGASQGLAPMGREGGYQLQVASFKKQSDADKLVANLRKRGHRAYRVAANVPGRGLWQRVRIGPFKTKYKTILYRKKFRKTERLSPYVVDPHVMEQRAKIRAAKLEARIRKYGRE